MMTLPDRAQAGFGLQFVEFSLTLAGMLLAVALPRMGDAQFRTVESFFGRIARKKRESVMLAGVLVIILRLMLLPLMPKPLPFAPNDFSVLLAADTFLHLRLTNPTPMMWTHFETIHVTMRPTYASMYFPLLGLQLALGKAIFGHPWFGVLMVTALMCAAICWMLQAWLPPKWALLGGLLAVLHLGLFTYWVNTYSGGGSLAALGGALIVGAFPRILRAVCFRHLLLLAIGVVLVGFTRPYEGMLLCLPVAIRLGIWLRRGKNYPSKGSLLKMAALPLALVVGAVGWLGYYDTRNFGSATTLPYTVDRATYAIAPYFVWQKPRPEPHYRFASMQQFYEFEARECRVGGSLWAFLRQRLVTAVLEARFLCGVAFLPLLVAIPWALKDRRTRFLALLFGVMAVGFIPEIYWLPHYLAPFTAVLYGLGLQMMRHICVWRLHRELTGLALVRMSFVVCLTVAMLRPFDGTLGFPVHENPPSDWNFVWYGPDHFGVARAAVQQKLEMMQGEQLVIVRYAATHWPLDQWVYNGADIDQQKVIWAQDMGPAGNRELLDYYKDRKAWLVQPDLSPVSVVPYPTGESDVARAHLAVTPGVR